MILRIKTHLLSFISLFGILKAQHQLSGTITHVENAKAVVGAVVTIPSLNAISRTDGKGLYRFIGLKKGKYILEVTYPNHATLVKEVSLTGDLVKDFVMENAAVSLDAIVVSGSSGKTRVKESPLPISIFTHTQWLQSSSTNLVDAVAKQPGISQISTGPSISKPVIRGLGFNRVITLHDGIRQEDNAWGAEHGIQVDEYSIGNYEIIRGAGSLLYGSDGLGGILSVLSRKPMDEGSVGGELLTNYQTNQRLYGGALRIEGTDKGISWMSMISHKNAGNYKNKYDDRVFGSNYKLLNFNSMIGIRRSWGYSQLRFASYNEDMNIITGERDEEATGRFTKPILGEEEQRAIVTQEDLKSRRINPFDAQELHNYKAAWKTLVNIGDQANITTNFAFSKNIRKEFEEFKSVKEADMHLNLGTFYYDVRYHQPFKDDFELTLGTNGMYQELKNRVPTSLYPNYDLFDNGFFLFGKKKISDFLLSGGLRYDWRITNIGNLYQNDEEEAFVTAMHDGEALERTFDATKKRYFNLSASLGGVYNIGKQWQIRVNGAKTFRAPSIPELASNGAHAGTKRYERGNINLKAEDGYQVDFGFAFENRSISASAALFNNYIKNYIYTENVVDDKGNPQKSPKGYDVVQYKQGNSRLQGVEAQITLNPTFAKWVSLSQNYTSVFAKNLSADDDAESRYLPFIPAPRWITQLRFSADNFQKIARNLYLSFELEHNQKQNRALFKNDTETETPAYTLFNIGLGADIVGNNKSKRFSFYVSANNLFDKAYQPHQSRLKNGEAAALNPINRRRGVFNMGRNISFKVVVPFFVKQG